MQKVSCIVLGLGFLLLGVPAQAQSRPPAHALSAEELFRRVSPSVFVIESLDDTGQPIKQGSAVAVGKVQDSSIAARFAPTEPEQWELVKPAPAPQHGVTGSLLETNYHVIKDGVSFEVHQGPRKWSAALVATNPDRDVAELRVANLDAPPVPMRPFSSLVVGEHVYAIGAPEGLELTLSEGLISSLRQAGDDRVIQTTAAISPGSSGGGLFDASGRLVGITVAYLKEGQNLNFALPTDSISSVRWSPQWAQLGSTAFKAAQKYDEAAQYDPAFQSYNQAVSDFQQSVRLDPRNEALWSALGDAYSSEHTLAVLYTSEPPVDTESLRNQERTAYMKAVQLNPDDEHVWWSLGMSGLIEDQVNGFKNVVRIDPVNIDAWEALAKGYCGLGQDENALTALATAHALVKPPNASEEESLANEYVTCYMENTAELMTNQQNPQFLGQALECAQSAVRLQPNDPDAWETLGSVYDEMKDRAGVMKVYEKLKTLDPKAADDFFQQYVQPNQQ